MLGILIFLALIPLALSGIFIIGVAAWVLLPIAMLIGGAGLAFVMHSDPAMRDYYYYFWSALMACAGFFWLSARAK